MLARVPPLVQIVANNPVESAAGTKATAEGKIKANGTLRGREARLHKVWRGTRHFGDGAATRA